MSARTTIADTQDPKIVAWIDRFSLPAADRAVAVAMASNAGGGGWLFEIVQRTGFSPEKVRRSLARLQRRGVATIEIEVRGCLAISEAEWDEIYYPAPKRRARA